jgi:hypothetical protein
MRQCTLISSTSYTETLDEQTKWTEREKKNTYSQTSWLENPEELQLHHYHEKNFFFTVLLLFAQCKIRYWWSVTWLDLGCALRTFKTIRSHSCGVVEFPCQLAWLCVLFFSSLSLSRSLARSLSLMSIRTGLRILHLGERKYKSKTKRSVELSKGGLAMDKVRVAWPWTGWGWPGHGLGEGGLAGQGEGGLAMDSKKNEDSRSTSGLHYTPRPSHVA